MDKLICIMGKSCTGKDTIYKRLLKNGRLGLKRIVPYTTRPVREGEHDGVEYHFANESEYQRLKASGEIIEERSYNTFHGLWRYFTVNDDNIQNDECNYIVIGTLESYSAMKRYFGADKVLPVMIELDDGTRLQRALNREKKQQQPKFEELCRRFLADSEDFAQDKIAEAGITRSFRNDSLEQCLMEIEEYIRK
ncbi:MAG: guanylate kinase [Lachnospiraceae bacterium]|nr:guanylate kinase [Lachnospiraceae bacterium]